MRTRQTLAFVLGSLLGSLPTISPPAAQRSPPPPEEGEIGGPPASHVFCDQELIPTPFGWIRTPFPWEGGPFDFALGAGLWVGAILDRGGGPDTSVSTAYFRIEFRPSGERLEGHPLQRWIHVTYADTAAAAGFEAHTPLGIEVDQLSRVLDGASPGGFVRVACTIRNISGEWAPPGWDLENLYVGFLADPDVGRTDHAGYWSDDLSRFLAGWVPGPGLGGSRALAGDLAYLFDTSADPVDDVSAQVGILLPGGGVHAFRTWLGGSADPSSDGARYLLMRGFSDESPTIDPAPTSPGDHRVLLSVGPLLRLGPGEDVGFQIVLACGSLAAPRANAGAGEGVSGAGSPAREVLVTPNPIRIRSAARAVAVRPVPVGARVEFYTIAGRFVAAVRSGAGEVARWNLRSSEGVPVAAGIYIYRVSGLPGGARSGTITILR